METVAIALRNRENAKLLTAELEKHYKVLSIKNKDELDLPFDLGIVDGPVLDDFQQRIMLRRHEEEPVFLPFLLVASKKDIGYATRHLWKVIDELICTPIERVELQARVEILLRARRYSIQIKNKLEEIEVFSHAIGHDLKAPLRTIKNLSIFIKEDCALNLSEKCRDYCNRVVAAAERMEGIQDAIFTFMNTGSRGVTKEKVNIEGLLESLLKDMEDDIKKKKALIKIDARTELVTDRTLLSLALKNLIENALTYVQEDTAPFIEVSSRKTNNIVVIEVKDNGIGIPETKLTEIFRPFVRLHSAERYPGTGLGLSIVKKAVELLGGTIEVRAGQEGGSVFIINLPQR
ncbi:MAG: GHKL domain-containing protein [Nitrospirae bacterium]|nr:MAG: GHKL domain-containing protein [Nitrospirota bacterium]